MFKNWTAHDSISTAPQGVSEVHLQRFTQHVSAGLIAMLVSVGCSKSPAPEPQLAPPPIELSPQAAAEPTEALAEEPEDVTVDDLLVGVDDASAERDAIDTPADSVTADEIKRLLSESRELVRQQDLEAAARVAWDAWKLQPTNAQQIAEIVEVLVRANKFLPAISLVNQALEEDRASGKARVLLAQAYYQVAKGTQDLEKALSLLQKSNQTLLDLNREGRLQTYGRSGASMLLSGLTKQARLSAALGHVDETLNVMEVLRKGGYSQIDELLDSKEFKGVQEAPPFAKYVTDWQAEIRANLQPEIRRRLAVSDRFDFDFSLRDVKGRRVELSDFRGKVVLVDFWGTWCPPCRKEVPHLIKLSKRYAQDIAVVGIAYEKTLLSQWPKIVSEFVRKNEVPYTCLIGDNATKKQVPNFRSFPTMLFLDRQGQVRLKLVGYHGYAQLDAIVDLLIAENDQV